ncbi:unnamed protein product [Staphylococcus haemolyticus JCSC1435]|uniref:Uncharacterized protein n=1 Tax=Staphylococcus haemolyticus (strain JCSC1435) TaxID=279808 RepID=Q4L8Q1_STAHJ|nr:unnamed protein product [Staphylococcus haemolyticus JCSC1435]
MNSVLLIFHYL